MHATIALMRGLSCHTVVERRGRHRACSRRIGDMAVTSSGTGDSGDVYFINRTLWADSVSTHALVEETESSAYIGRDVAIGDSTLVGGSKDGGCLRDCELLSYFFFFLPVFFFFFCCCEEVEVSGSDGNVESGIGNLDGLGLLGGEFSSYWTCSSLSYLTSRGLGLGSTRAEVSTGHSRSKILSVSLRSLMSSHLVDWRWLVLGGQFS